MSLGPKMPSSTTTFSTFRSTASNIGTTLQPRTARNMPSGSHLPRGWRKEMDRFICQCDALGDVEVRTIVRGLKKKFASELGHVAISCDAVERRILALDYMENDYFVKGMEIAVRKAEAAGFMLPPMDFEKYARPKEDPTEESYEDSHAATELGSEVLGGFPQDGETHGPNELPAPAPNVQVAPVGGRVRLVNRPDEPRHPIQELEYEKENRDYVIPIKRMEGLSASGTSALLSRRAGLKDSGSVASLAYSNNSAATSSFDAVGRGSSLPRSDSLQKGHNRNASGPLLTSAVFSQEPSPSPHEIPAYQPTSPA